MSRKLFWATTVAVVCSVGAGAGIAFAGSDGTGLANSKNASYQISDEVAGLLGAARGDAWHPVHLSHPVEFQLSIKPVRPTWTPQPPLVEEPPAPTSAELPLVPLPPPVWTGAAGLAGLGLVGICKKARKALR
jgi:hypothetical protein